MKIGQVEKGKIKQFIEINLEGQRPKGRLRMTHQLYIDRQEQKYGNELQMKSTCTERNRWTDAERQK